jgi:integrase
VPKKTGPEPWYRARSGRWYVTVRGEQINLGPDEAAAHAEWHRLLAGGEPRPKRRRGRGEQGPAAGCPSATANAPPPALTADTARLDQALDLFLDCIRPDAAERTHEWYVRHLSSFATHAGGGRPLRDVRPADVLRWLAAHPAWRAGQRRGAVVALRRAARWLVSPAGLATSDFTAGVPAPAAPGRERGLSEAEYADLLAHFAGTAFVRLLAFVWHTGCRPQEACRLELGHVDLDRGVCVLPAALAKGRRRPRVIYLNGEAAALAREEVTSRRGQGHAAPLFVNAAGGRWNRHSVACCFQRFRRADGKRALAQQHLDQAAEQVLAQRGQHADQQLRRQARQQQKRLQMSHGRQFSLGMVRHSWATRALRAGLSLHVVSRLMGHASVKVLEAVYSHLHEDRDHLAEQLGRVT